MSTDCFGSSPEAADETTPFQPQSPYAVAKAAAFWAVVAYRRAYNLFFCNGILSNHESTLRPSKFVTRKIVQAAMRIGQGSPERLSLGNLDVERDWGWAPDYADAIWRILQHSQPEDFVIATRKTVALRSLVEQAFGHFGLDWRHYVDVDETLFRPSDIPCIRLNPAKAERLLGWRPKVVMPALVTALIEGEAHNDLGPVPWLDGPLNCGGAKD